MAKRLKVARWRKRLHVPLFTFLDVIERVKSAMNHTNTNRTVYMLYETWKCKCGLEHAEIQLRHTSKMLVGMALSELNGMVNIAKEFDTGAPTSAQQQKLELFGYHKRKGYPAFSMREFKTFASAEREEKAVYEAMQKAVKDALPDVQVIGETPGAFLIKVGSVAKTSHSGGGSLITFAAEKPKKTDPHDVN